ncbi:MAG: PAS domain-containing sensor histidine kinase [Anaerolineae bacterium]|nr:PAS domain-containing sensor histidine kinase [Anaerolineae bacterium]
MHSAVNSCLNLSEASIDFLRTIEAQMGIVADLSRADILLYARKSEHEAIALAHAQPHSLAHVYSKSREGYIISNKTRPEVMRTLITGQHQKEYRSFIAEGAPVVRQALPVHFPPPLAGSSSANGSSEKPRVVAALIIVTNLIEYERHRLRSRVFQQALKKLQLMVSYGQVPGAEALSPFGEQDGIIFVDDFGVVRYVSGVASNFYRRLGFKENLVGHHVADLETADEEIRRTALAQNRCLERDTKEGERYWVRKVLPLTSYSASRWPWLDTFSQTRLTAKPYGVLIAIHDATESRRQDQEIRVKNAMIQEVHHRVKNNLQTIAGLLRMQARRVKSEEARQILDETLNRILSIAVIHEFLSNDNSNIINIKEVSHRIVAQFRQGMLSPDKEIQLELVGEPIYLPARQATACSLIINELLQNAIEHGFEHKQAGFVRVNLADEGDEVIITVIDNGDGLPPGFKVEQADSLGFHIVKILVEEDLKGQLLLNNGNGLTVTVKFPKILFRGEEGWKEHVSL